jgi:hemolysin III
MSSKIHRPLSLGEEIANAVTHGAGLAAAIVGIPFLVMAANAKGDPWRIAGVSIFGGTLVALYAASTLYHSVPLSWPMKRAMRVVDHSAIYLLIAGTYTPFTLGILRGLWGYLILGFVWTAALLGILFKTTLGFKYPRVSTWLYIAMGWVGVFAIKPLAAALPLSGLLWLFGGGALYTGGVIFYTRERLRYAHAVWHLFVIAGSTCHWLAVYWYA